MDISTHHNVSIGRVEVCINSAWGTICNSEFDDEDAEVICTQLGGYNREGELSSSYQHNAWIL